MYHQWEKELRHFIERELAHDSAQSDARRLAWGRGIDAVYDLLKDFGWDCRAQPFFPAIDGCRLVVNVHKHGEGRSLDELARAYPQFLTNPAAEAVRFGSDHPRHEWLTLSEKQFDETADAITQFWTDFPERLFATN